MPEITEKIYLCYHSADQREVEAFLEEFDYLNNLAVMRDGELDEDIVKGADKHEAIHKIRERYLKDSTVTLVLLGPCTYTRRSVDLELLASLHYGGDDFATSGEANRLPNGLLAVMLPSYNGQGFPSRLNENLSVAPGEEEPYAEVIPYPENKAALADAVARAARKSRESPHLANNTPHMFSEDRACVEQVG